LRSLAQRFCANRRIYFGGITRLDLESLANDIVRRKTIADSAVSGR
jgi:hypothetical protein